MDQVVIDKLNINIFIFLWKSTMYKNGQLMLCLRLFYQFCAPANLSSTWQFPGTHLHSKHDTLHEHHALFN